LTDTSWRTDWINKKLQPLQPRNLGALLRHHLLQCRNLAQKLKHRASSAAADKSSRSAGGDMTPLNLKSAANGSADAQPESI
jgi:hypothetical protein